jgi:NAD(P)-dependent dehydrogenase (short-subunit alcohol dehydrogenase family)
MKLEGRTALVTGAARGIGRTLAEALAGAGARVVGLDVASTDVPFELREGDVTSEDSVASALDGLNRIDILVSNAGIFPSKPFLETTLEDWRRVMSINLEGAFIVTKAALPRMIPGGWGRIVYISSSTVWLGVPTLVPYVASKMGLIGLTRSLAAEFSEHGITVNAITPGLTETQTALESGVGQFFDMVVANQLVKRRQQPADLVSTVLWLCDPATEFVTGQTVNVDGGFAKH